MKCKRIMALGLAVMLAASGFSYANFQEVHAEEPIQLPETAYSWDFEDALQTEGALQGTAAISEDPEKKSYVLDLNGTGSGISYMTLPEDIFSGVTEGLTISMWFKPDASTGTYTKLFDASNAPLGETQNGGNNWSSPDFALAAGGNVYDVTPYVGKRKSLPKPNQS